MLNHVRCNQGITPPPASSIPLPGFRNELARNVISCRFISTATPPSAPLFEDAIVSRATSIRFANSVPATFPPFHLRDITVARAFPGARDGPSSPPSVELGKSSDSVVSAAATSRTLPSKVVDVGRRASAEFWSASHISFFLGCCCLAVVVASVMGGKIDGAVEILKREVVASMTQWMKVCVRDTGGVMSSGSGERVTPVVVSNRSRDAMASSSMVADVDDDVDAEDGDMSLSQIKTARKRFVTAVT